MHIHTHVKINSFAFWPIPAQKWSIFAPKTYIFIWGCRSANRKPSALLLMVIYFGEYVFLKALKSQTEFFSVRFRNVLPAEWVKIGMKLVAVIFHSKTFFQFSAPYYFRQFFFKDFSLMRCNLRFLSFLTPPNWQENKLSKFHFHLFSPKDPEWYKKGKL